MSKYFKEKDEFEKMISDNGFLEWACFCDNYYGTPKKEVERLIETGQNVLVEIDIQGALQLKEKIKGAVS